MIQNDILYPNLWQFIEEYLPNYCSRDDVLESDILFRYVEGDEVETQDKEWIIAEFGDNKDAIKEECLRFEKKILSEAIDNFYEQFS